MQRFLTIAALAVLALLGVVAVQTVLAAPTFDDDAFARVWNRQDRAVFESVGLNNRSWTWGPDNLSTGLTEEYDEAPQGQRAVQYFDKSRMEITNPEGNPADRFYVTNGLLPIELMTGEMQLGNNRFAQRGPANVSAIGDPDNFPTYRDLLPLRRPAGGVSTEGLNAPIMRFLNPNGSVSNDFDQFENDPLTVLVAGKNGNGVARAFVDFQNQNGLVFEGNQYVNGAVYDPLFVFGFAITEPYWVNATVGGTQTPVLFQVFERRVLTYNPANEPSFRVEMGNVGQHYYRWRYPGDQQQPTATPEANPDPTPTPDPYP